MTATRNVVLVVMLLGIAGYFMLSNSDTAAIAPRLSENEPGNSEQMTAASGVSLSRQANDAAAVEAPNPDVPAPAAGSSRADAGNDEFSTSFSEADVTEEGLLDRLIVDGSIRLDEMTKLMIFDKQECLLRALRGETLTPEQSMRSSRYKQFVSRQPEFLNGQLSYNGMECGKSLCVLSVSVNDVQGWETLEVSLRESEELPVPVLMDFGTEVTDPPQHWLMFSIDADIQSITVHGEVHPIRPLVPPEE